MLGSRELRFEIAKEYLDMPSTASISRRLKASVMQNSEELIADEAPEPLTLICRIEAPRRFEGTRMAAMWCAELRQGYKKPVRFYTTSVQLFTLLRFCASTSAGGGASTARLCYVECLSMHENVDRCTATQKKIYSLAGTRCFVLLLLNQQLLITALKTNNSKDHQSS